MVACARALYGYAQCPRQASERYGCYMQYLCEGSACTGTLHPLPTPD